LTRHKCETLFKIPKAKKACGVAQTVESKHKILTLNPSTGKRGKGKGRGRERSGTGKEGRRKGGRKKEKGKKKKQVA
jgi:hypothetical protein